MFDEFFALEVHIFWKSHKNMTKSPNFFLTLLEISYKNREILLKYVNFIHTLESGINVPLRLLIFGIFSRGYVLITDLKDMNFSA